MSASDSMAKQAARSAVGRAMLSWLTFDRLVLIVTLAIVFVTAGGSLATIGSWWCCGARPKLQIRPKGTRLQIADCRFVIYAWVRCI
jgi:hypothetical protein